MSRHRSIHIIMSLAMNTSRSKSHNISWRQARRGEVEYGRPCTTTALLYSHNNNDNNNNYYYFLLERLKSALSC